MLAELADVQAGLAAGGSYSQVTAELLPVQEAAVPRGRSVWSSGLSVQGFPQSEYDQLLDVSSSFLETVQATALTMVQALGDRDAAKARRGAVAARRAEPLVVDAVLGGRRRDPAAAPGAQARGGPAHRPRPAAAVAQPQGLGAPLVRARG